MANYSEEKLTEAILVVAEEMKEKANTTKVAKALFYSDFGLYGKNRVSITGDKYIHFDKGPVPSHYFSVLKKMGRNKIARVVNFYSRKLIRPIKKANRSILTEEELNILIRVARKIAPMTSTEISNLSHYYIGYKITKPRETINYELIDVLEDFSFEEIDNPPQYEPLTKGEKEVFSDPKFVEYVKKVVEKYNR